MVEASQTVFIGVVVMAAIVLIQTLTLAFVTFRLGTRLSKIDSKTRKLSGQLTDLLKTVDQVLIKANGVREKLPEWEGKISRGASRLADSVRDLDSVAERGLQAARDQVGRATDHSDSVLQKISSTNERVHRAVVSPAHRLSAAAIGLQTAINKFFADRREDTERSIPTDRGFV